MCIRVGISPPPFHIVKPAIGPLAKLLSDQDDAELLADACWALSYLSDGPSENIEAVIERGISTRVVELLGHSSLTV